MEVKTEPLDSEMGKNYRKLQQNYARMEKENAELRKENAELKNEMVVKNVISKEQIAILNKELTKSKVNRGMERPENSQPKNKLDDLSMVQKENVKLKEEMAIKDAIFKQQIATMNEELTKMKRQNRQLELEKQQSHQKSIMEISQHTIERAQNELFVETMIDEFNQRVKQNLANNIDSMDNDGIIIKRELENAEMLTNCPFQIPTTSSSLSDEEEENCDEQNQNGLEKFVVEVEGLEKIEWEDEESGSSSAGEMDLEDGEDENGTSENVENVDINGLINCAPIKIGNIFKCNWPGCEYRTKRNMKSHWRIHNGERPYICMECGQSFAYSKTLKSHVLIHNGEKPHQCDVCGKSFRQSTHLAVHKRIHTGERPYQCDVCDKSFRQTGALQKHKRTHTNERNTSNRRKCIHKGPYQCKECGKIFKQSSILNEHLRTHTDERPFFCGECGQAFKHSSSLNEHKRNHTGEKPYLCTGCGNSFKTSKELRKHRQTHSYPCTTLKNPSLKEHEKSNGNMQ